jgi:phosphate transport system protein
LKRLLDVGLEELATKLMHMRELAERTLSLAILGFLEGIDVSDKVQSLSDMVVNMSGDAEDTAFELISKFQPVASDLRIIKSYMKIGYDLERYGRYAWDISFIHKKAVDSEKCIDAWQPIRDMAGLVVKMVRISIQALRAHDAELARSLSDVENKVDEMYLDYLDYVTEVPCLTKCAVTNLLVVRYMEKIADHATYIGESVIYIATGEKVTLR